MVDPDRWRPTTVVAVQGLGLSLLSPRGAVGEKRSEIAVE